LGVYRHLLKLILCLFCLFCLPVSAAQARQSCLICHPSHYAVRGSCTTCHRGNPNSERKNIAHQHLIGARFAGFTLGDVPEVREGKRLMDQLACQRCHVSGGRGNRLATDLDVSAGRKAPEELVAAIRTPARAMPDFRLPAERLTVVVTAILSGAQGRKNGLREQPFTVHFDNTGNSNKDIFTRKCGGCHRALTLRLGAVGSGDYGPNLSGLMSLWYPASYENGTVWTRTRLGRWLKNPRAVRPWALMQPVVLTDGEFTELEQILGTGDSPAWKH
jgi:mono/diheme cytochrome c family protein